MSFLSIEVNINEWHGTGYISVNPTTGITTDKVLNRTTGLIFNGGYSTKTVSLAMLAECIFAIDGIVGSIYLIDAILLSIGTLNPVVGGLVVAYGAFCMASAIYNYLNTLDLMYKYMNGDQYAGAELVENAVQDAIWTVLSFGLNQAVKYVETPAVTSKYIDTYGEEVVNAMSKGDPDFIAYPDGTIVAMKGVYETTGNINDVYELSTVISQTPNFDIVISDNTEDICGLISSYGYDILYSGSNEIVAYGKYAIQLMNQYGESVVPAIAIQGKEIIDAQANGDTATVEEKVANPSNIQINYNDYIPHLTQYTVYDPNNKPNSKKAVAGNHKREYFFQFFDDAQTNNKGSDGNPKYECEVISEDVLIDGVTNINYKVKWIKYDMGKPTTNYKYLGNSGKKYPTGKVYTKTVYTSPVTDDMIIEWSKEALQNAIDNNRFDIETDTYIWGEAKNGLKFEGYRNNSTNKITTFYPVENWTKTKRILKHEVI